MWIPELLPLLEKVEVLQSNPATQDVYAFVRDVVAKAETPSMGQSACEKIITMCHPRAWGDMYVQDFGKTWTDWLNFLSELQEIANSCGQRIYERYADNG
jgi:hypothetical protein